MLPTSISDEALSVIIQKEFKDIEFAEIRLQAYKYRDETYAIMDYGIVTFYISKGSVMYFKVDNCTIPSLYYHIDKWLEGLKTRAFYYSTGCGFREAPRSVEFATLAQMADAICKARPDIQR